jgi:hypothetical protein
VARPFTGKIQEGDPANATALPTRFLLALNRAGQFRVEMKATDQVTD